MANSQRQSALVKAAQCFAGGTKVANLAKIHGLRLAAAAILMGIARA